MIPSEVQAIILCMLNYSYQVISKSSLYRLHTLNHSNWVGRPNWSTIFQKRANVRGKSSDQRFSIPTHSFVILKLALAIFYLHTKFGDSHFSCCINMVAVVEIENMSCNPILGVVFHRMLGLDIVYVCPKYDDSCISRSRDIVGAQ